MIEQMTYQPYRVSPVDVESISYKHIAPPVLTGMNGNAIES